VVAKSLPERGGLVGSRRWSWLDQAVTNGCEWPAPVWCLAGVVEAPGSRAAGGRRAAIAERPLTLEGGPVACAARTAGSTLERPAPRGFCAARAVEGAGWVVPGQSSITASDQHQPASSPGDGDVRDDRPLSPGCEHLPAVGAAGDSLVTAGPGGRRCLVPAGPHGQAGAVRVAVVRGRLHQQPAGVGVPGLGDRALRALRTGGGLGRHSPR